MSPRAIIQGPRDDTASLSMKGFDGKFQRGLVSQSCRAVVDASTCEDQNDALKHSCWANLPPELLRDVLIRIEESSGDWPLRRNVAVCAGVCRSWREIMTEIVKVPEVSGKLTFPISVKQPGPRDFPIRCFIKRDPSKQMYYLYLGLTEALTDDGKLLLVARRSRHTTCTDFLISLDKDNVVKSSYAYIGKLRSNFLGTKFTVYDALPPCAGTTVSKMVYARGVNSRQITPRIPPGNYPVARVLYEVNMLGSRGPRRMECDMDSIPASAMKPGGTAPMQTQFPLGSLDTFSSGRFFRSKSARIESSSLPSSCINEEHLVLKNKAPRWHEQLHCWCLNFQGRVTMASVKNFQLVAADDVIPTANQDHDNVILQFGKVGKDLFTMDYRYPISAFHAFAICLSSFHTKIARE